MNAWKARARVTPLAAILTIIVLAALLILVGGGLFLWARGSDALAVPTPTPSSTPSLPPTTTPDFRATHIAQDMLTQVAYNVQLATRATAVLVDIPSSSPVAPETPAEIAAPDLPLLPDLTATAVSVLLPVIERPDLATATAIAAAENGDQPISPIETPVPVAPTPITQTTNLPVVGAEPSPTASPIPTPTPTLQQPPTPTATFIPTPPPPTPTSPPPPTLTYIVGTLSGVTDRQNSPPTVTNATLRLGPSTIYTATTAIPFGATLTLQARDATGDWIYLCCAPNTSTPGWLRAATVRPVNNPTPQSPFSALNPNDTRWLQVRANEPGLVPLPVNTPAPANDFPMARHDRANSGRVPQLPQLPLQLGWDPGGSAGLAGGPYSSGVMVYNNNVFAASADGHLYSFDRESGGQRWRYYVGEAITATPLADSGLIYVITQSGRLIPLNEQGGEITENGWAYNVQPHGSPIAAAGRILFNGRVNNVDRLFVVDRTNGSVLQNITITGTTVTAPAVGGQLIFASGDRMRAYDYFTGALVWQSGGQALYLTPPLYVSPGVEAAAELYASDSNGILTAFDANTGTVLWQTQVGGAADGLAANSTVIVASGNGFVRAFARTRRSEGQLIWQAGIGGRVLGGPLIDDGRVFVATDAGAFQYFDVSTGALIQGNVASPQAAGAVAVSGPWIYVPSANGVLFAARQVAP